MREIRFRGKDEETGKWVYGYPIKIIYRQIGERVEIMPELNFEEEEIYESGYADSFSVDPDTVGQGVKIAGEWFYEGDIFWDSHNEEYCVLVWDETRFVFEYDGEIIGIETMCDMELCGNVWDNPDLVGWYNNES